MALYKSIYLLTYLLTYLLNPSSVKHECDRRTDRRVIAIAALRILKSMKVAVNVEEMKVKVTEMYNHL